MTKKKKKKKSDVTERKKKKKKKKTKTGKSLAITNCRVNPCRLPFI
jgi:hypothetical protein